MSEQYIYHKQKYIYRGDRLTDPDLKGKECAAVKKSAKCICGNNGSMLVYFYHDQTKRTVLRRSLRKVDGGQSEPVTYSPSGNVKKKLTISDIYDTVINYRKQDPEDVYRKNRVEKFVYTRHLVFFFGQSQTRIPMMRFTHYIDRDHTTALHGIKKINKAIRDQVLEVIDDISALNIIFAEL